MAVTFEQFFWSIAQQESGSNYGALGVWTGGDRAYGKYQVMGNNVPGWTKAYYGKSLTPQQFLNNPSAQEAVARGKLQSYFNKYGARGAAAAWYSGNPNMSESTRSQYGGPSVKSYVDQVISRAGGAPSDAGGVTKVGSLTVPTLSAAELAEEYGFTSAFLNSNGELKRLFNQAVKEGMNATKFAAKLKNTDWWKTHSDSEKKYLTLKYTDPATAKASYSQAEVTARAIAEKMGIRDQWTDKYVSQAAYNLVAKGWNESQVRNYLGQYINLDKNVHQGEAGEIWNELAQYQYSMGVEMSGDWFAKATRSTVRGLSSIQDYKNLILNQAAAQFPQWSKQLNAGQTVADIAQPYMQSMAQILELPGGSVNLFDPTVKSALNWTNPATAKKEAMPLWQYENTLRNDPRWKKTTNAQNSLMQVGHQVLADFGVKY
ncbi:MAG TPA: hypothetical protein VIY48_21015 [Candidatus Paceibacterota bacterium]